MVRTIGIDPAKHVFHVIGRTRPDCADTRADGEAGAVETNVVGPMAWPVPGATGCAICGIIATIRRRASPWHSIRTGNWIGHVITRWKV